MSTYWSATTIFKSNAQTAITAIKVIYFTNNMLNINKTNIY